MVLLWHWFQAVEVKLKHASWSEFSKCLLDRFGQPQKEHLVHQLFLINQIGLVLCQECQQPNLASTGLIGAPRRSERSGLCSRSGNG